MELLRALGVLVERAGDEQRRVGSALEIEDLDPVDHADLFDFALYPYASVYLGAEGMLGGEARDRIAGFWRALGLTPPEEPDHLATMLAFYAQLAEREAEEPESLRRASFGQARTAFFWEHLASWLPVYVEKARALARDGYARWAELLHDAIEREATVLPPQADLPLHLREAPAFPDPGSESNDDLISALLAPVRTGFILVRDDLRRMADALGVALRQGERRYVLGAMLAQDREVVLRELARLAEESAGAHAAIPESFGAIGGFWEQRARASAALLG